jgi:hypothetical protein
VSVVITLSATVAAASLFTMFRVITPPVPPTTLRSSARIEAFSIA